MRDEVKKIVAAGRSGAWNLGGWCVKAKALDLYDRIQELSRHFACPLRCVELGVLEGKSLFVQAIALRDSPYNGSITGIDPYTPEANAEGFDLAVEHQREHVEWWTKLDFSQHELRCRQEITAHKLEPWCELRRSMPDDIAAEYSRLHWLHLDDCHSPVASLRNAQVWVPKLVPGGMLCLDDVHWPTMQPAREWIAERLELVAENAAEGMQWQFYRAS